MSRQKKKSSKESLLFPDRITTKQQSVVLVKRLLAISVSCITYLRGLFPESSYGTRYLDATCCCPSRAECAHCAFLQQMYTNPEEPETVTELYQFKFKYKKEVPEMDIISNKTNFVNGVCSEDMKQASSLLIRKLYLLMQNLGPLPNDITLTMKLLYYNVTPDDYQPPGFKKDDSPGDLLFDGDPVNLKVGSVSTGFHTLKVKVTTENKRMRRVESNLTQKNSPTEISHQGLDCDEEEEEGSTKISCLNLEFSQEEVIGPKKKRKVSEPEKLLLEGRK
ncbi:hypothetical protein CIB84_002378 [Bambusicola thoracicus]|uniref:HORMA domain-containing protein n=1 Tax=Bambusicola thoracicus TaxID=9083 RepID=A0A2P4TBY6_BAMTH|nr:hypothetical protein CIB84_002378 [Bambusicola thoracicus]